MKVRVGVSNRHVHLCKEDRDILFGYNYEFRKRNDLSQKGEYATMETVKISTDNYEFPYVRVLGPLREYTQVEISLGDAEKLLIDPPVRSSGDLDGACGVWIEGPCGKIYKENCCIRATRHIHCNKSEILNHNNNDIVKVYFMGNVIDDVYIKMGDNFTLEMHIDKSDAMKYGIEDGDYIDLE